MKKILILSGRYLPGYKDGGPVRSIKNLVDNLGNEYEFRILTCDRDHGDKCSYANIKLDEWNNVGNAKVYYVKPNGFTMNKIRKLSAGVDIIYSCGIFSRRSINAFVLNKMNLLGKPLVVASMGMFSPNEFKLKYRKKKTFVSIFNAMGLFNKVYWSATSKMEISEIIQQVKVDESKFFIAEDLPRFVENMCVCKYKKINELDVVWISRITNKKNLLQAIIILSKVKCNVKFTIYGPVHTETYWNECKVEIEKLPSNIKCEYKGNVESEKVVEILSKHHVFLFPTLGENYGHVIQEALSAACPCILSDQTPWQDLEKSGVGFVCYLNDEDKFVKAVEYYAKMNEQEFNKYAQSALDYAIKNSNDKVKDTGYRKIFDLG